MAEAGTGSVKYMEAMDRAVDYVKRLGFEGIRARHEEFDEPAHLKMQGEDKSFVPDITAMKNGGKYYFEIADRSIVETDVVGKWKLMATLASMKGGDLRVFVPYGCMKFTTEILEKKNIKAEIIKLAR